MARSKMSPHEAMRVAQFRHGLGPVSPNETPPEKRVRIKPGGSTLTLCFKEDADPKEIRRLVKSGLIISCFFLDEENLCKVNGWQNQTWSKSSDAQRTVCVRGLNKKNPWYKERLAQFLKKEVGDG